MRKYFFLLLIFCAGIASAYSACPDSNDILTTSLPCEIITPASLPCWDNATIIFLDNQSINQSVNMTLKYPGSATYNISFNFSYTGYYWVKLCDNSTAIYYVHDPGTTAPVQPVTLTGGFLAIDNLPPDLKNKAAVDQLKYLGSAIGDYVKNIFFRFYWVLIILAVIIAIAVVREKKK